MPREETDNSQASVLPLASPYNHTHPNPRHSHNSSMLEWRGGMSMVFPTIYTPQYADREKGRLRCGGGGRARRKRSSSLLPRDSVCCSAGQTIWSLSTARVITSSSSSYCRDWGGSSTFTDSSSSEEEWSSVEPAPREEAVLLSLRALPERALDLEAVDGERDSPVSISCSRSNCELRAPRVQTPPCLGSSGTWTAGLTRENPVHKQEFSGAKRTQRQALTIRAISSLIECSHCVLRSQASHALLVCVSSSDETLARRHTRLKQAWLALALKATLWHSAV